MRLCRYLFDDEPRLGFFSDDTVLPLLAVAVVTKTDLPESLLLTDYLPGGPHRNAILNLQHKLADLDASRIAEISLPVSDVKLLVPIEAPGKLLLLAGNYSKHIEEGGGKAEERAKTFPYVFMKPPATTLTHPGDPVKIPAVSPDEIDWELELAIVVGRECKGVSEADALDYVAGYTVINDISDRAFRPNPGRNERPKDGFFDWLHGKWHDTFCPMGPAILPADEVADPQKLKMKLTVNETVEQDASTAEMVFPVAAIIEFISSFVTLHPGDVISTGTPDGVGKAKGKFLKAGDQMEAWIENIGSLKNPVI
ncbi:Ureidoglycolate lyase [Maioricimonas rarisocia]|uniref:Ureidoglycolate lyase n=1 Tax=Maioricimonas rarisocia TaxID=2528026 RepID=A0A517Z8U1_9PLAN|nr:fumarylacetoacetate hydrolase family protein [Maioricimonas rarisocia]QDU38902.1 Ureidoglycolate lyase [Maioricimonas rarisocia]